MVKAEVYIQLHVFYKPLLLDIDYNGIFEGMEKLECHFSNLCFCNGISPKCESCSGMDPINHLCYMLKTFPTPDYHLYFSKYQNTHSC
jgi:hypothetical protein